MSTDPSFAGCADDASELDIPFTLVIYGGGGDLARKKLLPNLFHLYRYQWLPNNFSIVAAGSPKDTSVEMYRALIGAEIQSQLGSDFSTTEYNAFAQHLHFMFLRFEDNQAFANLKGLIDGVMPTAARRLLHYLAVPPHTFATVVHQIGAFKLNGTDYDSSLIIEKPFGTDLASAQELNRDLQQVFREEQIFRIDHYLGKETVQNILFFRFSNSMFEPLWNNKYIDNVQITIAEDIGIESRGKFYEQSGVIRDIIQNHGLQLLALVAMEPPATFDAESIRDEKVKVCRSLVPLNRSDALGQTVIGQYSRTNEVKAYRDEAFVATDSVTPTFFAGTFRINNWRWAGVPFHIRAGKRLGKRLTDIVIQFKSAPTQLFAHCHNSQPGTLTLSIQPQEAITMSYQVKYPNTVQRVAPVAMTFKYADAFKDAILPAYGRLILDALKGDLALFVRQDGIEAMWRFMDPIIQAWQASPPPLPNYNPGSTGPEAACALLKRQGARWHTPLD